jgi:hypothetical protein
MASVATGSALRGGEPIAGPPIHGAHQPRHVTRTELPVTERRPTTPDRPARRAPAMPPPGQSRAPPPPRRGGTFCRVPPVCAELFHPSGV